MDLEKVGSKAFQLATLKSESYRIMGLLYLVGALGVYAIVRNVAIGQFELLAMQLTLIALTLAYEGWMYLTVKKALKENSEVPEWRWYLNVFVESQIPTLGIFLLVHSELMPPYQALVAPALLVYFLFIILSTLRLRPDLSLLMGVFGSLGYLAVTLYTMQTAAAAPSVALPERIFVVYAVMIFASGGLAAFVAKQIRGHVASALREAELQAELDRVSHDLGIAKDIQQGLFPAGPPKLTDFDVAGWNKPADETGGDYYDWQFLPDGRIALSLADATGHGIGPALVGVSCRAYARASMLAGEMNESVLGRLNSLLAEDLESNRFVTFCVIFLNPKTSAFEVLSAGHGPILWHKYDEDKVESLEAQGVPLGMLDGFPYEAGNKGELGEGDFIALATDGFFEWENPEGEDFGIERMENVLRESRDLSAEEMVVKLREAVAEFCRGTKQMDDLTAVILKRKRKAE